MTTNSKVRFVQIAAIPAVVDATTKTRFGETLYALDDQGRIWQCFEDTITRNAKWQMIESPTEPTGLKLPRTPIHQITDVDA